VVITEGKLNIKFMQVTEDSRCPSSVTCIWQGQATSSLQITTPDGYVNNLNATEPGLNDSFSQVVFQGYTLYFHLKPYPEKAGEISQGEYRLALICTSVQTPIDTEADVTGFITSIQAIAENDIIGRISVESHADKIVDKYVITVTRDTGLFREAGGELQGITFNALEDQQWVKLWFEGPVMESFPMQATASQIVIFEP
jgi:hypothetical protein